MPVFVPTRGAGLARMQAFLPQAAHYLEERSYARPGHPTGSRLSPWLQRRLITEEEVAAAVVAAHPWARIEKYLQELSWRTYWKGWLEHHPAVWTRYREEVDRLRVDPPAGVEAARAGTTGLPGFDDWARELATTGWLHNHVRMWFASIWIFTLRLPWQLGADFFQRHLLDGDAAVNTLSWRWVAGLHTPGKIYLAQADNIARYTEGRIDLAGRLADHAEAVVETPAPEAVPMWAQSAGSMAAPAGLWLHPEDLSVETAGPIDPPPITVLAAWPATLADEQGWTDAVNHLTQEALADGATRAAQAFGSTVHAVRTVDLASEAMSWARNHDLCTVVAMRPAVGPWLEAGLAVEAALARVGVGMIWRRRPWDDALYPHARRGFFPFWNAAARYIRVPPS